jgi:hypothetical protein
MRSTVLRAATVLAATILAGCSSPATTAGPGPGTNPPVTTPGPQSTGPVLAGEACSYLTAAEVGAIVGTVPVTVEERAGRGDCDYFLTAAEDAKVNIGFFELADGGDATFESTKSFGDPVALDLGDEAYSIFNESIGTIVLAKAGDSLIVVQALNTGDRAAQLQHATKIAQALYDKI